MKNKEGFKALDDWRENNPPKFDAWIWFVKGVREQEKHEYLITGEYQSIPMGKLIGEFSVEYDFKHREDHPHLYNQDLPENFHLADSETIGGIINRTED